MPVSGDSDLSEVICCTLGWRAGLPPLVEGNTQGTAMGSPAKVCTDGNRQGGCSLCLSLLFLNTNEAGMSWSLLCKMKGQGTCHRPGGVCSQRLLTVPSRKGNSLWTMSPSTFSSGRTCNRDQIGKTVKESCGWPSYISQVDTGLPAAHVEHVLNDMSVVPHVIFLEVPFHLSASFHSSCLSMW